MRLEKFPNIHLSYCTNVHPGSDWNEIFSQLKLYIPEIKKRISPENPFGIGLRLSAKAAFDLQNSKLLDEFQEWLNHEELYVFTMNGFVYGSFHNEKVKDKVYKPDWSSEQRFNYTSAMINILAQLTSKGGEGSISTSPISYKYWDKTDKEQDILIEKSCYQLAELAHQMALIKLRDQKIIHLDIEPEPDCFLENSSETIDYFQKTLWPLGSKYLVEKHNYSIEDALNVLKNHIMVCFDTCHFALEYEDPENTISKFQKAGIQIGKVQLSSALKVNMAKNRSDREQIAGQLKQFVEPVYLHQVLARKSDGSITQYRDLDQALDHIHDSKVEEWRVHFHVPVFIDHFGMLTSTQDETIKSLHTFLTGNQSSHFEVETYTWEVLPDDLKMDLTDSLERELQWVINEINQFSNNQAHNSNPNILK